MNTRCQIFIQAEIPSTRSDITTLIRLDFALRAGVDETKKYIALLAAAFSS
jgi:hypothetical protein